MNFDGSRCGDCNKEIYQRQRFCDKCGNRLDHSINEGKSPKGKKKRSSRYNVLTFFGCCGANNEPVIADTTIRENINRDISLESLHIADKDKLEPHDIVIVNADGNEHISPSAIREIHTDINLQREHDGIQKQDLSAIKEIQTDEHLQSEHKRLQEPVDIDSCLEHGSSDKKDIQKDGCLQSEHDEHKDPQNSECSLEHGHSSKKDRQTDDCLQSPFAIKEILTDEDLQSEHERLQEPGDIETSIEHGSSDKEDIQKDGCLQSEHDEHKDQRNSECSLEHGLSSKKDIQTDECLQSEYNGCKEPQDKERSIEKGPSASAEIQTDEDLQSEHERLRQPVDIDSFIEHGPSDKKNIQTDGCLQNEHDRHKEPRDTERSLEHGASSKKDIQTDVCLQSEYNGCKEPQDIERSIEKGPSASEEIQTDEHLQSEHERLGEPVDIDSFIEHGSSDKEDTQKDGCLQSEHDEHKDPRNSECSLEHGSSAIKEIQTDEHLQSEHDGLQKPDDIESSIEHGPSAVKDIHTYESVQSEHDGLQKQVDIDSSNEDGLSTSKEIQTDGNLQSVYGRLQEPGDIKSSIEHGPSNKKEIQADICLESEQAGHKKPRDIESSLEHGSSAEEEIQNNALLQMKHLKEPGDTKKTIEIGSFTENDIQREQYVQSEHDGLHDYIGNIESSTENEADFQKLYAKYKEYGFMKTTAYFRKKLNEVNTEIIKLAVIGRSAVGKSSFINMMLDLKEGTKCFAETGSGDTTEEMIVYKHPKNENITFWDMPGFGTIDMPKDKFTSEFGPHLHTFDYFFIFIDTVIMEADLWLVNHIQGFCTPYCLVRSKVDEDVKKGRTKEVIRQKLKRSIETNDIVKGSALFLISNVKSYCHTGDLRELFAHVTKKLPKAKGESLAFFLEFLTPELIEKNFKSLQKRIPYIAFTAGFISAVPIPLVDIPVNIYMIGTEIEKYYRIFLLDKDIAQNVPGVKNKKLSKYSITQSAITFFKAVTNVTTVGTVIMSQADIMVPGAGSVVAAGTTFTYASQLLSNKLKEMKNDALSVYEYYAVGK